jgi:hypothetical protein
MAVFYADSSVLVKRHVVEAGSLWVENVCDPQQGNQPIEHCRSGQRAQPKGA